MHCPNCGGENLDDASFCMACAARLSPDTESPDSAARDLPTSSGFVGRQRELAELSTRLQETFSGKGRLVMLVGEPGIGKTRTAQEFSNYAVQQGARALWGRCYEEQGMPPYWPWVQAVRLYIREQPPEQLRSEMGSGATDIADIILDVKERLPDLPPQPRLDNPDQARFRLFDSITSFLKAASKQQPMVIVLDDLHWADQSSLLLLQFLARELDGSRLMLVGTYRDMELSRQHPLAETLGDLTREQLFHRLPLRGLSEEDIASFIEAMAGTTPSPGLVHKAYYQTEGNPLFVAEIVRLLVQEGEVGTRHTVFLQEADHWSIGIPEGVREVIGRRLNRLSQECNDTLTLAAIIGREFGLDQLRTVTENLSENKLLEVLESAMAVQVIEELPASRERYQFTHALIQETLANELSATRRIRVHARIAEALEELYGGRAQEHAAELAFHFAEAVTVTGTDKLVKYSLIAGEQALASYAYREALSLFQRAISAQGANPGSPALDAETADLLYGLGRAQVATLPIYQLHEAVTSLRGAFDYYIDTGDLSQAVAIAEHPFPPAAGHPTGMATLVQRALELAPQNSAAAGRLLATFGWLTGMEQGSYAGGSRAMEQGLAIARRDGETDVELRILVNAAELEAYNMHWRAALDNALEAVELARQVDDPRSEALAHYWSAFTQTALGESGGASHHLAATWEAAQRIRHHFYVARSCFVNEVWHWLMGHWEVAREYSDQGLGASPDDVRLLSHRVILECEAGNFEAARAHLDQFIEFMRDTSEGPILGQSYLACTIPLFIWLSGAEDLFEAGHDSVNHILGASTATPVITMWARIGAGLLAIIQGDVSQAKEQLALLSPHKGIMVIPYTMAMDRLLGLLARSAGEEDEAITYFQESITFCRRTGYRSELAWSNYDYAESLLHPLSASLKPVTLGVRGQAIPLLDEALSIGRELGMVPLIEKASELLDGRGGAVPQPAYPAGLSHREVEVLRLVATGYSNRRIAEELVISLRTVASHVTSILNKTGSANRAEAATYASRQGLV